MNYRSSSDINIKSSPDYYEKGIKENFFQRIWHRKRFNEVLKIIPEIGGKYLDVGCHGGFFTSKIKKRLKNAEVYGIDIDDNFIRYCEKIYPQGHWQKADAHKLPFSDRYFDLITCFEVLEHITDPKEALREMRRCLKKEGELIVLIPTESWLFRIIWYFWIRFGRGRVWYKAHINQIKSNELASILKNMGFEILKIKKSHFGMLQAIKAKLIYL
jgi:ubiquinone/menaquinone biosynthesis C-methylase UbiE